MKVYSKLKQYYRYRRIWKKFKSGESKIKKDKKFSAQLNFYSQFITKGDLCFDIGANIGDKTKVFLQLGATVVAVEPQESCWRLLKQRFQNDSIHIVTKALDKTASSKEIFVDRFHTLSSMLQDWITAVKQSGRFSRHNWSDRVSVETTTLDALIADHGEPVFCKIDVEGSEFEVVRGLSQPIKTMSFEFVPEYTNLFINCIEHLSKLGQPEFNYSLGESMELALPGWVKSNQIISILSDLPKELLSFGDVYARFSELG